MNSIRTFGRELLMKQRRASQPLTFDLIEENDNDLRRRLGNRQIQMLIIGGSIGTALFVSIGQGLAAGGPGSLFIAYTVYTIMLALVNSSCAEMSILMPVSGGFIRLASAWVDDAFGFMAGWNFFLYEALLIPFEITALCQVLEFWRHDIPQVAVIIVMIVLYSLLNIPAVGVYGEAEFWLSSGKVILICMLFAFTLVTMSGGNPERDAFGFRNWQNPGSFAEHSSTGNLGRFEGFLTCIASAAFCCVGTEYCSVAAAETKRPRIYVKNAFKAIYWRLLIFFVIGAVAVGILVPYNDPWLISNLGGKTATASPYVIAMQNLGIVGLPHLVNALLVTSIFSAGNAYAYCATRVLYGLALEGKAPGILKTCTKQGIPILCFLVVMLFACLAFLQLSNSSAKVLTWLINLTTAGGLINYITMSLTYIRFYKACQAQHFDRAKLPYIGWFQPYCAYISLTFMTAMVFSYGYSSFQPWDVRGFFTYYTMLILAPILYVFWKVLKGTKLVHPAKADLLWERVTIDVYESSFIDAPVSFWTEMLQMIGFLRVPGGNDKRINTR